MKRVVMTAVLLSTLEGCAWFARKPVVPTPATPPVVPAATTAQPSAAARAACPNYDEVIHAASFPRDAIIRGVESGTASVRFRVDGTKLDILSVSSSDPAFGAVAAETIAKLSCRIVRQTIFDVPFAWRTTH